MIHNVLNLRITPTSSLVEFMEYDKTKQELLVKFKRGKHKGKERKYFNISNGAFIKVLESESVGKSLLKLIHDKKGENSKKSIFGRLMFTL